MTDKEIKKILKGYEESYAPWEIEDGDFQQYLEIAMTDFGRRMYELGVLKTTHSAPTTNDKIINGETYSIILEFLNERLSETTKNGLFLEVMTTSLRIIKENPEIDILYAVNSACNEWDV